MEISSNHELFHTGPFSSLRGFCDIFHFQKELLLRLDLEEKEIFREHKYMTNPVRKWKSQNQSTQKNKHNVETWTSKILHIMPKNLEWALRNRQIIYNLVAVYVGKEFIAFYFVTISLSLKSNLFISYGYHIIKIHINSIFMIDIFNGHWLFY